MAKKKKSPIPPDTWQLVVDRDFGCAAGRFGLVHRCSGPTVVHHRLLRSQGGGHGEDNLVALCNWAHLHVHANPAESYDSGLMIRGVR